MTKSVLYCPIVIKTYQKDLKGKVNGMTPSHHPIRRFDNLCVVAVLDRWALLSVFGVVVVHRVLRYVPYVCCVRARLVGSGAVGSLATVVAVLRLLDVA